MRCLVREKCYIVASPNGSTPRHYSAGAIIDWQWEAPKDKKNPKPDECSLPPYLQPLSVDGDVAASVTGIQSEQSRGLNVSAAVGRLDAENDDHWTDAGLPLVEAVIGELGYETTRGEIAIAAPGVSRDNQGGV